MLRLTNNSVKFLKLFQDGNYLLQTPTFHTAHKALLIVSNVWEICCKSNTFVKSAGQYRQTQIHLEIPLRIILIDGQHNNEIPAIHSAAATRF